MIGFNEIEYAGHTDVGIKRSHNQDSHVAMPAPDHDHWQQCGHIFLVADGMGAHAVGELASKLAIDNISHLITKYVKEGSLTGLRKSFVEANLTIHTRGKQNREFQGMGTTGTALLLRPEGAWVGHVGDSRAYRIRGGVIEQLSFDHSLLWEVARRQKKSPEEMAGIPSNVIVRSLGPEATVEVDVEGPHPLERGDVFLLCSDGLSGQVTDRIMGAVVTALPANEAARFLVHLANLQGGPDNITVIVVRVGGESRLAGGESKAEVVFPAAKGRELFTARFAVTLYYLSFLPWAFILLGMGILMAGIAIYLATVENERGLAIASFVVAVLTLLGGIVTLMVQNIREQRRLSQEPEERVLQVYRQSACLLDADLYERLQLSAKSLEESIREKNWEYDVHSYLDKQKQAAAHFKQQHMRDAIREACRALLVLMDIIHEHRGKNEDFKPLWDKPTS